MSSVFNTTSQIEYKKNNKRVAVIDERGVMLWNTNYFLEEFFQHKPALQAVNELTGTNTTLAYTIANKDFCVAGTNMTTALCTFSTKGGESLSPTHPTGCAIASTASSAVSTPGILPNNVVSCGACALYGSGMSLVSSFVMFSKSPPLPGSP